MMSLAALVLLSQLAITAQPRTPVLTFPEPGRDDPAAYRGYQTRFYRDHAGNTVQIYIEHFTGRVVHLLANTANESVGLTVRAPGPEPVALRWDSATARVSARGGVRTLAHPLVADAPDIRLGWFLLGSMRVERDFQYWGRHREPFTAAPFLLAEYDRLLTALAGLRPTERQRHLAAVGAPDLATLRRRLRPRVTVRPGDTAWVARISQLSLDGRDSLALEIAVDPRHVAAEHRGDTVTLRARAGRRVPFTLRVSSSADTLAPLTREDIFTPEFLGFLAAARDSAPLLERQVSGVELLVSRDKFMAGLPAYATYFGRDMLVSALMMRSIWRPEMSEFAIASVLRKLGPRGEVSHEEALGEQAVREAADEYARLVAAHAAAAARADTVAATRHLQAAYDVLRDHRRVRENYHMVDDEFQFPVLVARWMTDPSVPAQRKMAFLRDTAGVPDGVPRVHALLRQLALVAALTGPYARHPVVDSLVSFAPRDTGWFAQSWRDSGAGYAGGRFAMDVNAIWVPHALESLATILHALPALGFSLDSLMAELPELVAGTPLGGFVGDTASLRRATDTWWGAARHFEVRLDPVEVQSGVHARLAALPTAERAYWTDVLRRTSAGRDSLVFLAVALDARGAPIPVMSTDPATLLFLGPPPRGAPAHAALIAREAGQILRPYPVGLFIASVGPVVANDAYATPAVWSAFENDRYHGPRVVWGREVNLFLLGAAHRAAEAAAAGDSATARELRAAADRVLQAARASGFQSELWSYEVRDGTVVPVRYGTGSDVQLWSTTDLAVQYAWWRLRR